MSQKINFSDYTASGVYFIEIDNSIVTGSSIQAALRLAVGFNMRGPFNRPVYLADTETCTRLFGGIDRKLERRGCFTNRNVRTMIPKAPVYVLNLLNVDTSNKESNKDTVGFTLLSLKPTMDSSTFKTPYAYMYDRTKFWIADDGAFVDNTFQAASEKMDGNVSSIEESAMFGISNCGTKDISVIIRKSENVQGYNLSFLDFYGNQDDIPYPWINPNDFVSDYFVDVYIIAGDWGEDKYASFAGDVVWSNYFTEKGLKKDTFKKFLRLDAVNVIAQYTGCILPNFLDKQGNLKSINYLVNKSSNETGLLFGINEKAMDAVALDGSTFFIDSDGSGDYDPSTDKIAAFAPDFVGHMLTTTIASDPTKSKFTYMSCNIDASGNVFNASTFTDASSNIDSSTKFALDAATGEKINIGDYVRANNGLMARIIKKRGTRVNPDNEDSSTYYMFTATDVVNGDTLASEVEIHKSYTEMYDTMKLYSLAGLKICNRHMPGYDSDGKVDNEAGVEKIYSMLKDPGIQKGLLNNDSIDFRYVVDTMAYGLKANCGGKVHLADLANAKGHCTAFINAPSMSQFAASDAPFFGDNWMDKTDPRPVFDIKYIQEGGNQDMIYSPDTESFSLPDEEHGANHVGVFAPFFRYTEGNRFVLVPPAADVCNTFMNKFTGGDPYKTVANTNGVIDNPAIAGVEFEFDETDRGYLENMGINPIINRGGTIMIYGDRTAYQTVNSDLSFLHVRELLNTIEISCKSVLDDYVFTYNIPTTRAEIVTRINPILSAMQDSGALVKYEIECDDLNNDKDVIDNKFCIVDIGVWISQNMEKIVVPITLNRSTTA